MSPIIIKVLEPIGFESNDWIEELEKKFPVQIDILDTRGFNDEKLIPYIKEADALILTNRPLSKKVLESASNLKFISVAFTGTDHIDKETTQKQHILVKNAAGYSTHSVSELVIGSVLQLYRKIAESSLSLSQKDSHPFPLGLELFNKRVGIIGNGTIGKATGNLFEAFGCLVSYYSRNSKNLEEILKNSDIISLHLPLTQETRHFINKKRLSLMNPNAILINTARGAIVDLEALVSALTHKKLAGASLDVFDIEPPLPHDHLLLEVPNLLLTPHIGYRTKEAILRKADFALNNLKNWIINLI